MISRTIFACPGRAGFRLDPGILSNGYTGGGKVRGARCESSFSVPNGIAILRRPTGTGRGTPLTGASNAMGI